MYHKKGHVRPEGQNFRLPKRTIEALNNAGARVDLTQGLAVFLLRHEPHIDERLALQGSTAIASGKVRAALDDVQGRLA